MKFLFTLVFLLVGGTTLHEGAYKNCSSLADLEDYDAFSNKAMQYVSSKQKVTRKDLYVRDVSYCDSKHGEVVMVWVAANNRLMNWKVAFNTETNEPIRLDSFDTY